jgi:hypothetical protein
VQRPVLCLTTCSSAPAAPRNKAAFWGANSDDDEGGKRVEGGGQTKAPFTLFPMSSTPRGAHEVINMLDDGDDPSPPRGVGAGGSGRPSGGGVGGGGGGGGGGGTARRSSGPVVVDLTRPDPALEGVEIIGYKPAPPRAPGASSQPLSSQLRQRVRDLADAAARVAWRQQQQLLQQQQQQAAASRGAGGASAAAGGGIGRGGGGGSGAPSPAGAKRPRPPGASSDDAGGGAANAAKRAANAAPPPPPPPPPAAPQCCLCLEDMKESAATPCGHVFCRPCLVAAVKAQHRCPTCRKPIKTVAKIIRVYLP